MGEKKRGERDGIKPQARKSLTGLPWHRYNKLGLIEEIEERL
jgi:hypothetical protein